MESSLSGMCKKFGNFSESLTAIYMTQVLEGLKYLHDQGVLHRDIKGANILTTKHGLVKLADFGVAMKLSDKQAFDVDVVRVCRVSRVLGFRRRPRWLTSRPVSLANPMFIQMRTNTSNNNNNVDSDVHPHMVDGIDLESKSAFPVNFEIEFSI